MGKIILNGTEYAGSGGSGGVIYLPTIYSDEEREVGVWRDGKPLYQKTINIASTTISSGGSVTFSLQTLGIQNAEKIINADGTAMAGATTIPFNYLSYYSGTLFAITLTIEGDTLMLSRSSSSAITLTDVCITVQYTKTTDVAGSGSWTPSGANAVHYSTNEQVIGTWIDGKPLYEKVVKSTTTPRANAWNMVALPNDISVKIFDAYYVRTTGDVDKFSMYRSNTNPAEMLVCTINNSRVDYQISSQYVANFSEFVIIIRYTKNTD